MTISPEDGAAIAALLRPYVVIEDDEGYETPGERLMARLTGEAIASRLGSYFAETNPGFDRSEFLRSVGMRV